MDLAALILAILALLMSGATLVIFLAKNVFSSHVIQMVPVDSETGQPVSKKIGEEFEEFDAPTAMDLAIDQESKKK